jgi:FkbM family methyltransferase
MINFLLKSYAKAGRDKKIFLRILLVLLRRFLALAGDPAYVADIRGKKMILPASHKLPIYIASSPYYDALPPRISNYIRSKYGFLCMVDIGANVGDTILACFDHENDRFLAVEANPDFVKYLNLNSARIKQFTLVEAFCHSGSAKEVSVHIDALGGTARIREGTGIILPRKTLDEILNENRQFEDFNFLKIDTDGNDFDVLKGAHQSILKSQPTILIECDVFDNNEYINDFAEAMKFFVTAGYSSVIVYDNYGNLFRTFNVRDFISFKYALFYQLVSQFGFFDLLVLKSEDKQFIDSETSYFVEHIVDPARKNAARDSLNL